jgi:hypothetical protein
MVINVLKFMKWFPLSFERMFRLVPKCKARIWTDIIRNKELWKMYGPKWEGFNVRLDVTEC